jgi:ATP-binding cassette subfamily C protein
LEAVDDAGVAFGFQAALDILRSRILSRVGERFDRIHSDRVHEAVVRLPLINRMPGDGLQPLRNLDNVRSFMSGSGPTAFFDLPWIPLYLAICFLFHFYLGATALGGAIVLVSLTLITNMLSQKTVKDATSHNMVRNGLLEASRRNAEVIRAMGLSHRMAAQWQDANGAYLLANRRLVTSLEGLAVSLRVSELSCSPQYFASEPGWSFFRKPHLAS